VLSCSDRVLGAVLAADFSRLIVIVGGRFPEEPTLHSSYRWWVSLWSLISHAAQTHAKMLVAVQSYGSLSSVVVASKPVPLVFTLALVASTSFKFFVKSCLIDD